MRLLYAINLYEELSLALVIYVERSKPFCNANTVLFAFHVLTFVLTGLFSLRALHVHSPDDICATDSLA